MKKRTGLLAGVALAMVAAWGAQGQPTPRLKPAPTYQSSLLSKSDFDKVKQGLAAADKGDWSRVRAAARSVSDKAAAELLRWRVVTSDPQVTFAELDAALADMPDWPRADEIRAELENRISTSGLSAARIVARFEAEPPQSGVGYVAFAEALFALGRESEGNAALKKAWRERILPISVQDDVLARYRSRLTKEDHIARVDYLLWREQRSAASRLYSVLPADYRALADARAQLAARSKGVDAALAKVPASLQKDPGLLYERARWRRKARRTEEATALVMDIPADTGSAIGAERVWYERRVHISRMVDDRNYAAAYQLASSHGINPQTDPSDFADAEWLSGWLALQKLGKAKDAAAHFARMSEQVSTPISKARALYWQGRAAEALEDAPGAEGYFRAAAAFSTVYYGQLAATRLADKGGDHPIPLPSVPNEANREAFFARPLPRATAILAEVDDLRLFREFSYHLDDQLDRPVDLVLLAEVANKYGQMGVGVRAGKAGLQRGIIEPVAAYPVPALAIPRKGPAPEDALVYAISRQESEFYPRAVSSVGARGLMQIMPATARATARSLGAGYRESWLTDDPDYNVKLGSAYLDDLVKEFNGSYALAAAAYNAGENRAREWIAENGDPRTQVDPVDWVESIPFSETRNYVQRVLENTLVYRARLTDGEIDATIEDDLRRGGPTN